MRAHGKIHGSRYKRVVENVITKPASTHECTYIRVYKWNTREQKKYRAINLKIRRVYCNINIAWANHAARRSCALFTYYIQWVSSHLAKEFIVLALIANAAHYRASVQEREIVRVRYLGRGVKMPCKGLCIY